MYGLYGRCMLYGHTALYGLYALYGRGTMCGACMGAHTARKLYEALYGNARLRPEAGVKKSVNTVSS